MTEYTASWLIQKKVAESLIFCNPVTLLPKRFTGRWRYPSNDDVSDFTFGMARHDMDCFCASHF
jgi:hypothetical protein